MGFDIHIYTDSTNTKKLHMKGNEVFAAIDYAKQNLVNVNQYAIIHHAGEIIAVISSEAEPADEFECPECPEFDGYKCPEFCSIEEAFDGFIQDLKDCGVYDLFKGCKG